MFNKEVYIKRREKLKELVKGGVILIIGNLNSPTTYKDNAYNFIQESTFLYYFGLNSPDLIGIIDIDKNKDYIFGREFTLDDIVWTGEQKSFSEQAKEVGIENFEERDKLQNIIEEAKKNGQKIHYIAQDRMENSYILSKLLDINIEKLKENSSPELLRAIVEMRSLKEEREIVEIEKATDITADMHLTAMKIVKPGMRAFELIAEVERIAKLHNATISFQTICTNHGEILHNLSHNDEFKEGDMILLDCGAKLENGYCGDMTTVFPVSKKFTERQKDIYSLLIKMFDKAVEIAKAGITNKKVHLEVCKVLTAGMIERGLMKGEIEEIVEAGAHALFFVHGLGHMIGLDVHDMENLGEDNVGYDENVKRDTKFGLKSLRMAKELKVGYVLTIEPGIYFIPELIKRWKTEKKFEQYINYDKVMEYIDFGGMRYEGDFLITENGNRRLGKKMPKEYFEVEECMRLGDRI